MSGAWLPMVATRVALPLTLGAVLLWALTPFRAAACALFLLMFLLVMIPIALAIKDNDVHRRREIARIRGLGPKGRGEAAFYAVLLVNWGLGALDRRGDLPLSSVPSGVQIGLVLAMVLAVAWWRHEQHVFDREVAVSGPPPPSPRT